jgi:hypothetical protein
MKKTFTILLLTLALSTYCNGQKIEEKSIQEAFDNYKAAILNDKGDEAVKYIDSKTIKYYSDILELAINADSSQVNCLSLFDRLMVFSIRHRISKEEVLSFDGEGLLIYAIKSGMVGKSSVSNSSIGELTIENNYAKGQFMVNEHNTSSYLDFYLEAGQWKINLTSGFSVSILSLKKMIENSGQNENEYLFSLLEMITGKKPGQEIWNKVK